MAIKSHSTFGAAVKNLIGRARHVNSGVKDAKLEAFIEQVDTLLNSEPYERTESEDSPAPVLQMGRRQKVAKVIEGGENE